MRAFKYHMLLLFKRTLFMLILLAFCRILFYFFNQGHFEGLSGWQVFAHCFIGIRFDISTFFWFNIPFILLSILPVFILSNKWFQSLLKALYIISNSVVLALNFTDIKFFEFSEKRITTDVFNSNWLGDDFITMLPHFLRDYWYLFVLYIVVIVFVVKFYPSYNSRLVKIDKTKIANVGLRWLVRVLILGVFVLGGRGGVQMKPLSTISAAKYSSPKNMPLILNSAFTLMKSIGEQPLNKVNYFTESELNRHYSPIHTYSSKEGAPRNVVLIILESFGKEYSGYLNQNTGFTPNLDSIMAKGLTFTNCFANGKRSIEALPSILSSIPALMEKPFITSNFTSNSISSIGSSLNELGYSSSFYHGGKNGTMGFDNYVRLTGIENYYGLDEYTADDFDEGWGIFDEPYLKYVVDELNSNSRPFFTGVFTLSSHHPYTIPEEYTGKFPKGTLVNHESIAYADYALGEFFKKAEGTDWYANTLFVITADHTAQSKGGYYVSNLGRYSVPLVLYAPGDTNMVGISDIICSQVDIYPTIMEYVGYDSPFIAFGQSVFNDSVSRHAASYVNGVYQLLRDSIVITSNGAEIYSAFSFDNARLKRIKISDSIPMEIEKTLDLQKAIIQQYNNRMLDNELTIKE